MVTKIDSVCRGLFLPVFIFIVALGARVLPWGHVFSSGKLYLFDPDCYIRLRKIFTYTASFPSTYVYDYYQGYPQGTGVISSPAMEILVALLAYPFRNMPDFASLMGVLVAILPPVIGAATTVLVYRFMEKYGRGAALISGLVLALYPRHIEATVLGRFDNEMVEPLLLLITFWLYLLTYTEERGRWPELGVLSAVYLMMWRGALFPLSIIGADLLLRLYSERSNPQSLRNIGRGAAIMYLSAAAILFIICITDMWGTRGMFSFNIISWFHVSLLALAAVPFILVYFGAVERSQRLRWLAVCSGFLFTATAFLLIPFIKEGLKVVGGGNAWIDSISQYQRLAGIGDLLANYGLLSILVPFALLLLGTPPFKHVAGKRFLITWTVVMIIASIARTRYAEYLALNVSILTGITFAYFRALSRQNNIRVFCYAIMVVFCLQLPTYRYFYSLYRTGGTLSIKGDIEDTLSWLRANTPPPGNPYRPYVRPDYGVLARWDYGGWLESIALRPSVATNYGTETYGMEEVARFFLASGEEEMRSVLDRNKIRYVVIDKVLGDLPMYARLIGLEGQLFTERRNPKLDVMEYVPSPRVFSLVSSRLFFADGTLAEASGISFQPVEGLRLVYESASRSNVGGVPWEIKRMKVFEYIRGGGATVAVTGQPGAKVAVSQLIETNQGRRFSYRNEKIFDSAGKTKFKIFYTAKKSPQATGAVGPLQFHVGGTRRTLYISDEAVLAGSSLGLSL